ncbi:iron ABC transporter permease [Hyphobacterium sp. HN65]|uniref:Iron ABC transporter permease n=1 Tax=Hyphobacterium lacteum TaxID=3116575 RepID=A0ABU7LT57_9PROT|nr:iron ABC transporter permease [Hyphobacterium sp. HN65]MEE2527089.1 iron ABC transporter permease [Hyphobacterium sp. HN65]
MTFFRPGPALLGSLAALVAAGPILAVAWLGVTSPWDDYLTHLASTRLAGYIANTLIVSATAMLLAGLIGTLAGWAIARLEFPGRGLLEWALALPLAVPAYVAAYGWLDLTQAAGPLQTPLRESGLAVLTSWMPVVRGPVGAGFVFAVVLYPYVYLIARQAFSEQHPDLQHAARTLGASNWQSAMRVTFPLVRPAVIAGLALVAMESIADFGAVAHLGAPTLTVGVVRAWAGAGSVADAARLAIVLAFFAYIAFALERQSRSRARYGQAQGQQRPTERHALSGWPAGLVSLACLLPILLGLVIPLARLGYLAVTEPVARGVVPALLNSLLVASITAVIAAALGLGAAYAIRSGTRLGAFSARLASLGYAAPGAVAAVGALVLFAGLQMALDGLWGGQFPILLSATAGALVFAYLSRFAAVAIAPSETALARVNARLDDAAMTLGASRRRIATEIHWPLIFTGIAIAALMVFVEVMKELPATMILRPFNTDTLAVIAHNYAADERLGQAALPSLILVLACLPAMILAARSQSSRRSV